MNILLGGLCAALISFSAFAQKTDLHKYIFDPPHTSVVFSVKHFGFSHVYGRFGDVSGQFLFSESHPEKSSITLDIKAASATTQNAQRDSHLHKPDFFNVAQYPDIRFQSEKIQKIGPKKFKVTGKLTLHGVTKPLTFDVTQTRLGKDPFGHIRTGGDAEFDIKRSEYGMNFMLGPNQLSDKVHLIVSFEGIQQ